MRRLLVFVSLLLLAAPAGADDSPGAAPPKDLQGLEWRCVGPHVGNRGCAVAMHPTDRNRFFHGHSSGGLWMTEDAGQYWVPIADKYLRSGSVGAIAVSPSNPDVIYVGTGEPQLRDCVSWGDGMYKSVDGGKTWDHIGLPNSRNIARVRVHPDEPRPGLRRGHRQPLWAEQGPRRLPLARTVVRPGSRSSSSTSRRARSTSGSASTTPTSSTPRPSRSSVARGASRPADPNSRMFKSTDGGEHLERASRENPGLPKGDARPHQHGA